MKWSTRSPHARPSQRAFLLRPSRRLSFPHLESESLGLRPNHIPIHNHLAAMMAPYLPAIYPRLGVVVAYAVEFLPLPEHARVVNPSLRCGAYHAIPAYSPRQVPAAAGQTALSTPPLTALL